MRLAQMMCQVRLCKGVMNMLITLVFGVLDGDVAHCSQDCRLSSELLRALHVELSQAYGPNGCQSLSYLATLPVC